MNSNCNEIYDVIQVGYGPVSQVLALTLGRKGYSVAVFEIWQERYPLPRAVCIDHEMNRMLYALGLHDEMPQVSHPAPPYRWFNAEWKELLHIDWSAEAISGGTEVNFIHQPTVENMLDENVKKLANVDVNLGWEVTAIHQTDDYAEVTARNTQTGESKTARAKYVIGLDGANSRVRDLIGADREDLGFEADWLVVDILPNEDAELDIPSAAQYCNPVRPTTIVPAGIKNGRYYRRWEFMRIPGESKEVLESEAMAWKLLEPWVKPHQAVMERHKVYNFRSLISNTWRDRRVLIAGDAAHVMPPFMGQGMCAGFRDDWNLAWKLDLILRNKASDTLLDTYQIERRPHARDIISLSMYLGKVICIADPKKAAERDEAFFTGTVPPPPAFPCLTDGILYRDTHGKVMPAAGLLSPHGTVKANGQTGRFDDIIGQGFILLLRHASDAGALSEAQIDMLNALGAHVVALDGSASGITQIQDLDNKYTPFLDEHGLNAMLVRPDFYLYGGTTHASELPALLDALGRDLERHGINVGITAIAP